jgi:hypothetical protein
VNQADDVAALFAEPPAGVAQPVAFRQGVVISFDLVTGANVINVAGTHLNDLSLLWSTAMPVLVEGDVVAILTVGPTWMVLGRIITPP